MITPYGLVLFCTNCGWHEKYFELSPSPKRGLRPGSLSENPLAHKPLSPSPSYFLIMTHDNRLTSPLFPKTDFYVVVNFPIIPWWLQCNRLYLRRNMSQDLEKERRLSFGPVQSFREGTARSRPPCSGERKPGGIPPVPTTTCTKSSMCSEGTCTHPVEPLNHFQTAATVYNQWICYKRYADNLDNINKLGLHLGGGGGSE